jgi:hypothetical protein
LRRLTGNPIDRRDAYRTVTPVAEAATIPRHVSPHSLRHAAITNALDAGVPPRDAKILARPADPRTTEHDACARGNPDRHAVHLLTADVAGAWGGVERGLAEVERSATAPTAVISGPRSSTSSSTSCGKPRGPDAPGPLRHSPDIKRSPSAGTWA